VDVSEVKELAKKYSPDEIERCIDQQLHVGKNVCLDSRPADEVVNELAKASFISEQMAKGLSLHDSLRELAKRIRQVYKADKEGLG
jgi:hypothetical protein